MVSINRIINFALGSIGNEPEKAAEFNAWNRKIEAEARNAWKPERCALCAKKIDKPCDSHTVPHFILRNLVDDRGKIYFSFNFLSEIPFWNTEGRPKSAGIFKLLCNDCDNQVFKIYEDPKALLDGISSRAATAIALKNLLSLAAKREREIWKNTHILVNLENNNDEFLIANSAGDVFHQTLLGLTAPFLLDLKNICEELETAKKALNDGGELYRCIYHRVLDYTIPVAYQGAITIPNSFYGDVVNNTADFSLETKMEYLHTVVFPLNNRQSVVALFVNKRAENYRVFERDFNELSEAERLAMVNYLLFFFEGDYYLSPRLPKQIFKRSAVKRFAGKCYDRQDFRKKKSSRATRTMVPAYRRFKRVENLLAPEYRILRAN